ncbi:MAG: 16S rRNA (guanine(527)-N(7))-methyltransferase RsmG [Gemmobacter sp.]|nr:16S rRNA (guanine(527)-N(7))-methyltransferase RsmG [Gemmobacter sp.]
MTAPEGQGALEFDQQTRASLTIFADLVEKWTKRINLISRASAEAIWDRHIVDSAQLWPLVPASARKFVDLGSGGGFPGIVLALLARQRAAGCHMTLVESDQRKAAFLREAIRLSGAPASVECARAEQVPPQEADVVSARALAPLPDLLGLVSRHLAAGGVALLPKGAGFQAEITAAQDAWAFDLEVFPSQTDSEARILRLCHLTRRTGSTSPT